MRQILVFAAVVVSVFVLWACGDSDSTQPEIGIRFVLETDGMGCPITQIEEGAGQLPSEIEALNFILYDRNKRPLASTRAIVSNSCDDPYECILPGSANFQLFNVPTQRGMQLEVQGFGAGNQLIWVGYNYSVDVATEQTDPVNQPARVTVYMRRVGAITNAHNCMAINRAFHTATVLRNRTSVLITGGASLLRPDSCRSQEFGSDAQCDLMVATSTVTLFDVETGDFKEMTELDSKRAGHEAVLLSDGRVLIMGGADQLHVLYNKDGRGFIQADPTNIKQTAVLYNPEGRGRIDAVIPMGLRRISFTATPIDRDPPYATRFLIAGGFGEGGRLSTLELLEFDPEKMGMPTFRQLAPTLKGPRAGHTATRIRQRGHVLFYGGTAPGEQVAEIFTTENDPTTIPSDFPNFSTWPNLYYHTAVAFGDEQKVLIAGGMQKITSGEGERFSDPVSNALLLDFDTKQEKLLDMADARAFHRAVLMPQDRILITGGVKGFNLETGVLPIEVFAGDAFAPLLNTNNAAVSLGIARFGHTATPMRDGSVAIIAGSYPTPTPSVVRSKGFLTSAEIYMPRLSDLVETAEPAAE